MADAKTDILLKISTDLAGLRRATEEVGKMGSAFTKLNSVIKAGIGIDIGGRIVGALQAIPAKIIALTREAAAMAGELKDSSERLNMTSEALQVLGLSAKNGGADVHVLTKALTEMDRSIGEARGIGKTADAYRMLGINVAEFARLAPERRYETIAKAIVNAKDQTAAFDAGSTILGARTMPLLLGSLREVSTHGYDALAAAAKEAGQVMEQETIARLERAEKAIEKWYRRIVIAVGEAAAQVDGAWEALKNKPKNGLAAMSWFSALAGSGVTKTPFQPAFEKEDVASVDALRVAEFNLLNVRSIRAQVEADLSISEAERREKTLVALREERALLSEIHTLKSRGFVTAGDNSPSQVAARQWLPRQDGRPLTPEELKIQADSNKRGNEIDEITKKIGELDGARGIPRFNRTLQEMGDKADDTFSLLNAGLEGMTSGIASAISEARNLGDGFKAVFKSIGLSIAQALQQMIAMRIAMSVFGFMGFGGAAATPAPVPSVAAAGGGAFFTRGRTNFTVGDNPGGVELVSVIPLSGRGVTRVNGRGLAMAGGGMALVGGEGGLSRGSIIVQQSIHISTGVQDTVRAEIYGMMPVMREMAVSGVQDAISTGQLRV